MKVVGYVRCSTDRQEASPDVQRAVISSWCASHGAELVSVHEDVGVSGAAPLDKRHGLASALATVKRGDVLLAAKRDRWARDVVALALIERLAERRGARVLTCDGASSGDGPEGALMRRLLDVFGEYERLLIGSRTQAAMTTKRRRGERVGTVPYGLRLADDQRTLVPDDGEQRTISRIRKLRARGLSLRDVASRINAEGHHTRKGKAWTFHDVRRVLDPDRAREDARRSRTRRRSAVAA